MTNKEIYKTNTFIENHFDEGKKLKYFVQHILFSEVKVKK